jgi:hypothetical protein
MNIYFFIYMEMTSFIYLLNLYPDNPQKIYKFGKTKRYIIERLKEYVQDKTKPVIILIASCTDCDKAESDILKIFKERFQKLSTFGKEYFVGDVNEMQNIIWQYLAKKDSGLEGVRYWQNFYLNISKEPAWIAWISQVFNGSDKALYVYDQYKQNYYYIFFDFLIKCGAQLNIVYYVPTKIEKNTVIITDKCEYYDNFIYLEIVNHPISDWYDFYKYAYNFMDTPMFKNIMQPLTYPNDLHTNLKQQLLNKNLSSVERWLTTLQKNVNIMQAYELYHNYCKQEKLFIYRYDKFTIWLDKLLEKIDDIYQYQQKKILNKSSDEVNIQQFINNKLNYKIDSAVSKKTLHNLFNTYLQKTMSYISFCKLMNDILPVKKVGSVQCYLDVSMEIIDNVPYNGFLETFIDYKNQNLIENSNASVFKKEVYLNYVLYCRETMQDEAEEDIFMDFLNNEMTGSKLKLQGWQIRPITGHETIEVEQDVETSSQISSASKMSKKTSQFINSFTAFKEKLVADSIKITPKKQVYQEYLKFCNDNNLPKSTDRLLFKYLSEFFANGKNQNGARTYQLSFLL